MKMPRRLNGGLLLAFDGIDGAGKTTQARALAASLDLLGFDVVLTKEPTDGVWGSRLRDSATKGRMEPDDELAAFIEDRREHVRDFINPSLKDGKVVILDRYYFSTVAYQGARGMNVESILAANESFAPMPTILFLLQVEPAVGLRRVAARGDIANLFEREDNLKICAGIFNSIDRPFVHKIDAERDAKTIADEILWSVFEVPIAERLESISSQRAIRTDKSTVVAKRIAADRSIAVGDKPRALLANLFGHMGA